MDQRPDETDFQFATTFFENSNGILVAGDGTALDGSNYFVAVRGIGNENLGNIDYTIEVQNFLCRRWSTKLANWTTNGCLVNRKININTLIFIFVYLFF